MVLDDLEQEEIEQHKGMTRDMERYIAVSMTNQYVISLQSLAQKAKDKLKYSKEYIAQRLDEGKLLSPKGDSSLLDSPFY
jgi:hypothetical protein